MYNNNEYIRRKKKYNNTLVRPHEYLQKKKIIFDIDIDV